MSQVCGSMESSGCEHPMEGPGVCVYRVCHGYGKTRGFSKMGSVGTGTVVDFGTPRHTAYPYRGIAGMYG